MRGIFRGQDQLIDLPALLPEADRNLETFPIFSGHPRPTQYLIYHFSIPGRIPTTARPTSPRVVLALASHVSFSSSGIGYSADTPDQHNTMDPRTNQSSFQPPLHQPTSFDSSQSQSDAHTHLNSVQSMDASISSSYQLDQFNPPLNHVRPTKRPRVDPSRTSMSYPRKRAVTACQLCRTRKTKCSNARPKCKFCADTGAECVYEDSLDHSS